MLDGGVPYCPWWGGPWGKHGVCPFDEPLRARGRSRSGYHVVVPALEDCNPDLWRGVVTVCRSGGGGRRLGCGGRRRGGRCRGLVRWPFPTAPGGSGPLGGPSLLGPVVGVWSLDA